MKIVIVEDEVRIREGITKLLNRFYKDTVEVYEAKSGEEGLKVIRASKPDVVITDIRMEPLDGLEMLRILIKEEKHSFKTIILSAYSEFEYAKRAISFGVCDYLVKPVDVNEFLAAMRRVEDGLKNDESINEPEALHSLESIMHGLIAGQLEPDAELSDFIENSYGLPVNKEFAIVLAYIGSFGDSVGTHVAEIIEPALKKAGYSFQRLLLEREKELLFVFYNCAVKQLERFVQNELLRKFKSELNPPVFGFAVSDGIGALRGCLFAVRQHLPWSISLGNDVLIAYPGINKIMASDFVYPMQIEKPGIEALYSADYNGIVFETNRFFAYITNQIYTPEAIKKGVIRYIMAILHAFKEINYSVYERIDESPIIEAVTRAVSLNELKAEVFRLLALVEQREGKPVGLLVLKARRMVEEYYRQGITLEEIASALGVTPEHISAQFVKELGVNFSGYIRNFRLQKAKELLLGTDLKLYEVAAQAGYSDAKYFSRVFKEAEGVLPTDYRKNHL